MSPELVLTIGKQTLNVTVLLAAPLLLTALILGLIVSLFQAASQINEMTLSFIPKLLGLVAVVYVAGPWMLTLITGFARRLFESIPALVG
ncbi:MAG: flagellar biosynthesis protein FliQ [Chromatiaceae bacterium]|jgi:flagellar biosynthetic protein FliQ